MQVLSTCLVSLALFANGARVQTPNKGHDMPAFNLPGASGAARAKSRTLEPEMVDKQRRSAAGLALAATMLGMVPKADAGPFTRQDLNGLSYQNLKGTGLSNTCPRIGKESGTSVSVAGGKYRINNFCLEPTKFEAEEERITRKGEKYKEIVPGKVMTRQTYVLTGIEGALEADGGKLTFKEQDGIDYAATTVQLPGGERVPFLFTVKDLVAKSDGSSSEVAVGNTFSGDFRVPSYRTGLFLDPKGRGTTTGYDQAIGLAAMQAGGDEDMFAENNKVFEVMKGNINFKVTKVNNELGEISGEFIQKQPSDTDLGGKKPTDLILKGNWFATVDKAGEAKSSSY